MRTLITLALALCFATEAKLHAADSPASSKPNIIYLMSDELGYYEPGFMGSKTIQTPNLDKMAAGGPRRICLQTREHIAAYQLTLGGVAGDPVVIDTKPVCVQGPGAEPLGGAIIAGGLAADGNGMCGSCWAFFATERGVRFYVDQGADVAPKVVDIGWGANATVEIVGNGIAIDAARSPDGTATVTFQPEA